MFRILLALIILTACAPNKTVYQLPEGYQNSSNRMQLSTTAINHEGPYNFVSFDLDANFNGIDNTVEAEYSHKGEQVQALYKHKLKKIYFAGDYALNELHPILTQLTFSEISSEQDVIEQVIRSFNFPNDAVIHLKVEYPSGEKLHYTKM